MDLDHLTATGDLRVKPQFDENLLDLSDKIDGFVGEAQQNLAKVFGFSVKNFELINFRNEGDKRGSFCDSQCDGKKVF